ncbi:MAG: Ca-activated chloride channel family protein [Arenicella sp.]|jgi:Ca-activated chloride channel family protein
MTKILVLLVLLSACLSSSTSFAQEAYTYNLTVFQEDQSPYSGCEISLIESNTFERKTFKTNATGQLVLKLDVGNWVMNVGEMRNYRIIDVPEGMTGSGRAIVTYDVARWNRINEAPEDRSLYQFEEIPQRLNYNTLPGKNHELLEIEVLSEKKRPFAGIPIKITSFGLQVSYSAYTDNEGVARFKVPLNEQYQIDLDGNEDFEYHDTGDKPWRRRITLTYSKINFKEVTNVNGHTEQLFKEEPRPVSNRVMVTLTVVGESGVTANEDVYVKMDYSKQIFHGKTNSSGKVAFLLPKKRTFHVDLDYQKDAGEIDLSRFYGIGYLNKAVEYDPDPRLQHPERYLPTKNDIKSFDINNYSNETFPDTPDDEILNVHVKWGANKINSGSKEAILELGFSVKEIENKQAISKPLNVAFVLDRSGSMMGEKIDLLKAAMLDLIDKLRPQDKVSIIYFNMEAVLAYGESAVDVKHMKDVISALQASGGTSIYEGLKLGYEQVSKNKTDQSVDRVILLTDGYGSKPVDFILEQSKKYFEKGISVSTIGVGQDYNSSLLSMISTFSGGLEHQAIESEGITKALDEEFESLLYPVASNLKVKVKYNNKVIYKTLYGVPEKKNSDNAVYFELDKVYSSLSRMALMKFKIENPDRDIDKNKIRIEISYFDERKKQAVEIVKETNLEWTDETDTELIADKALKKTYSIAVINQAYKIIADLCDKADYINAKESINETLKGLKKINGSKYDEELIPLIEELKGYLVSLDRAMMNGVK